MQKMYYFAGNLVVISLRFATLACLQVGMERETTRLQRASRMATIAWCIFGSDDHAHYFSKA
jgi:hypothetical protein